jgi:UDP-N-acetylmuramoyl-tripeptide--D-alanyl-D-alanine ligase
MLFFALKGEKFDGNDFAVRALEAGAKYAVVDKPSLQNYPNCILVENTLNALQELAHEHRRYLNIKIIALTGSNGKTTNKELISRVLAKAYKVKYTEGNLNNHIGVPLTLLSFTPDTHIGVVEMGANHLGEIARLCEIAAPDFGLITNIGKAHIGEFGGFENIKKAKSEIYDYLAATNGTAFVNTDKPYLYDLSANIKKRFFYGISQGNLHFIEADPFVKMSFDTDKKNYLIESVLYGAYNFDNIATAVAIGLYFGIEPADICAAIQSYQPTNNRSEIRQIGTNTFILDAYNANHSSMEQALVSFANLKTPLMKIAIIGEMRELGDDTQSEHQSLVNQIGRYPFSYKIFIGNYFSDITLPADSFHFSDIGACKKWFEAQEFKNAYIFVKGSRSNALEKIL